MKQFFLIIFLVIGFACSIEAKTNNMHCAYATESKFIHDVCFSANASVLVCTDNQSLKAFSVTDQKLLRRFDGGHRGKILSVDLSSDSTLVVSGGADSMVVLRSFLNAEIIAKLHVPDGKITSVKFSPDGRFILAGSSGSRVFFIRVPDLQIVREFDDSKSDISSVAFNRAGDRVATAGADKVIRIYNLKSFKLEAELKKHKSWVRSVSFCNYDKDLISCSDDRKIYLWSVINPANIKNRRIQIWNDWILSVESSNEVKNNSNFIVFGTMNGVVKLVFSFGTYSTKFASPVTKVILLPNKDIQLEVVAATFGSGLYLINAKDMIFSE